MPVKVTDASAIAAILFNEPGADTVADRLEGQTLVAPELLPFEIASVCLKKIRKHPEQRDRLLDALHRFFKLPVRQVRVEIGEIVELAAHTGLTTYFAPRLTLRPKRRIVCRRLATLKSP